MCKQTSDTPRHPWFHGFGRLIAGAVMGLVATPVRAAEYPEYNLREDPAAQADQIPADLKSGRYTLWLPDDHAAKRIRGIIVVVDYEDGVGLWRDTKNTHMRSALNQIMTDHSFGMMLEYVINQDSQRKLYKNPENNWAARSAFHALRHYANVARHPELAHAPLLWTGLSQSGGTAYLRARLVPERTIGALAYHAAVGPEEPTAAHGVPILAPLGARDPLSQRSVRLFSTAVPAGALWLPYIQADTPHHRLDGADEHELVYEWVKWVIKARVPQAVPGNAPVELVPLQPDRGYYIRAGFVGDGTPENRFNFSQVDITPATGGRPNDAVGWIPNPALMQLWMKRAKAATRGAVTLRQ